MRRYACLFLFLMCAASLIADERGYKFSLTPDPHGLKLTEGEGTHWVWVMIGCPPSNPQCEWAVNDRGAGGRAADKDLGLVLKTENTVQIRCLRPACSIKYSVRDAKPVTQKLAAEETVLVPMYARVDAIFADR